MQNRINKKVSEYIQLFKNNLCSKISNNECETKNDLIKYIYDYDNFTLKDEDLNKRQRNKTTICISERCMAKRSNGEQCSRRKRKECDFCGTHLKGQPHGKVNIVENSEQDSQLDNIKVKVDVYTEEEQGVIYFKDKDGNYYNTDDVMGEVSNPRIIPK